MFITNLIFGVLSTIIGIILGFVTDFFKVAATQPLFWISIAALLGFLIYQSIIYFKNKGGGK